MLDVSDNFIVRNLWGWGGGIVTLKVIMLTQSKVTLALC